MRELWVEIQDFLPENVKNELLKASKRLGSTILASAKYASTIKSIGVRTASPSNGDIFVLENLDEKEIAKLKKMEKPFCVKLTVKNRVDEEKVAEAVERGAEYIIVECPDWKVIPLENLIAKIHRKSKLLAEVTSPQEAKLALETLELGADGVVLKTSNPEEIAFTATLLSSIKTRREEKSPKIQLSIGKILSTKQLGMGARVCVDTCDLMTHGEGMLLGCQSAGLFLVQAEVHENPHVEPRPFRVNAGPVSLYILTPNNKTRYLSELKAGEEVLVTDREGNVKSAIIGRIKIEKRPLMLVEAEVSGHKIKTIVQSAETIRFVTRSASISVSELKPNDEVLVYFQPGGRHFGTLVEEESVIEL